MLEVDKTWMWRLNPHHGREGAPHQGVRRLGPPAPRLRWALRTRAFCSLPDRIPGHGAAHATCCAVGHHVRTTQPLSLVAARLRWRSLGSSLALTCGLGNFYTAFDISICSPQDQQAGADCTQTRHEAKLAYCGPHLPSLFHQNISYIPIVWSAHGRPHRDTLTVSRSFSKSIARKRNFLSAEVVYQKLHASITLEIWKRSARQIRSCWPLAALPDSLDPES